MLSANVYVYEYEYVQGNANGFVGMLKCVMVKDTKRFYNNFVKELHRVAIRFEVSSFLEKNDLHLFAFIRTTISKMPVLNILGIFTKQKKNSNQAIRFDISAFGKEWC